ncbi:Hypothetical_protein [Hexamita inflata]|uniref:Hypothetical_protein n=1 Tax=Hexamita inflata TaxID=28002 RepID=A0AA86QD58_9EUKA|nr:Hypothetical protein HINF_LOCUS37510 [Hexamita inflata]
MQELQILLQKQTDPYNRFDKAFLEPFSSDSFKQFVSVQYKNMLELSESLVNDKQSQSVEICTQIIGSFRNLCLFAQTKADFEALSLMYQQVQQGVYYLIINEQRNKEVIIKLKQTQVQECAHYIQNLQKLYQKQLLKGNQKLNTITAVIQLYQQFLNAIEKSNSILEIENTQQKYETLIMKQDMEIL